MDEARARALLDRLASAEPPPSRVDIGLARRRGRRLLRWRRASLPGASALAVIAVAGLASGGVFSPGTSGHPAQGKHAARPAAGPRPWRSFSPLGSYASYGWLPAGFSVAAAAASGMTNVGQVTSANVSLAAGQPSTGRLLELSVNNEGACRVVAGQAPTASRTVSQGTKAGPYELPCGGDVGGTFVLQLTGKAPPVQGKPAYWAAGGSLVWEYTTGSWAQLTPEVLPEDTTAGINEQHKARLGWLDRPKVGQHPALTQSAATLALLHRVAQNIRYGAAALASAFELTGVPAGWTVSSSDFAPAGGRLLDTDLNLGPAVDPGALQITVIPAGLPWACNYVAGQSSYVQLDGSRFMLRTIDETTKHWQELCGTARGLHVLVDMDISPLDTGGPDYVTSVFNRMTLLGTNPADWTTHPLR